jgi:pantoate--beta-alanine ligase
MKIFDKQAELKSFLKTISAQSSTLGFVPTMGALHDGHLSLLKQSIENNTFSIISIFVNPTQFNNVEDLEKYPRTIENDVAKVKTISDSIIIYAPTVEDIYNDKTVSEHFDFDGLEKQMEGAYRPGHYNGVGTVVRRLFEIIQPTNAYFGEKDFQQLQIVKKLVKKLNLKVNIVVCPIYREKNGLAMSSRNERLTKLEKQEAAVIYKTLQASRSKFISKSAKNIATWVANTFKKHPHIRLEYFQIADENTLLPCIRKSKNKKYRAFIAVFVGDVRLIDTISL